MPQLATTMSVPLSCPLYLDLGNGLSSESNFKSPFEVQGNQETKNMFDMNFLYENLVKSPSNMYHFNPNLLAESFNYYLSQSYRGGGKSVSPKSFSIESILGFPNSSTPKDAFCSQLTFSDYTAKNGHCPVPDFVTSPDKNYRPVASGRDFEPNSPKLTDQQLSCGQGANMVGHNAVRNTEKSLSTLKHYPGLSRKSNKVFKSSSKSLSNQSKSKRVRTIFTPEQLERLETEFERQQYMVGTGRHYLASTLNLTEAQVKVWFQNRRIKWRKQHLEGQQQDKNGQEEKELL